jgi:hypothetical protein
MEIHSLAIPSTEPLNGEGVPEVIRAWADTSRCWLQSGQIKEAAERTTGGLNRQDPFIGSYKETRIWARWRVLRAGFKISI